MNPRQLLDLNASERERVEVVARAIYESGSCSDSPLWATVEDGDGWYYRDYASAALEASGIYELDAALVTARDALQEVSDSGVIWWNGSYDDDRGRLSIIVDDALSGLAPSKPKDARP